MSKANLSKSWGRRQTRQSRCIGYRAVKIVGFRVTGRRWNECKILSHPAAVATILMGRNK